MTPIGTLQLHPLDPQSSWESRSMVDLKVAVVQNMAPKYQRGDFSPVFFWEILKIGGGWSPLPSGDDDSPATINELTEAGDLQTGQDGVATLWCLGCCRGGGWVSMGNPLLFFCKNLT